MTSNKRHTHNSWSKADKLSQAARQVRAFDVEPSNKPRNPRRVGLCSIGMLEAFRKNATSINRDIKRCCAATKSLMKGILLEPYPIRDSFCTMIRP